jgi:hypothetical protein
MMTHTVLSTEQVDAGDVMIATYKSDIVTAKNAWNKAVEPAIAT